MRTLKWTLSVANARILICALRWLCEHVFLDQ
jgi:hypothetical protein